MPVHTVHRSYTRAEAKWKRCRHAYEGSDSVKDAGQAYLPMLEGSDTASGRLGEPDAYRSYKARALFYPAMRRTVAGLAGLVFGKPPTVDAIPKSDEPDFDDVTMTGLSLGAYGLSLAQEVLVVGRCGILVDMPAEETLSVTRPYWTTYAAESIINWKVDRIAGEMVTTRVVLYEEKETFNPKDTFEIIVRPQYRVLTLENGIYTVRIWVEDTDKKAWAISETIVPTRRGQPLGYIPFVFLSAHGTGSDIEVPPLVDLVDVNYSHYRTSADQEHGAHFTALPTAVVTGHELGVGEQMAIGSGVAWVLKEGATAFMLEFSGAGLKALADLKEEKRMLMATLGARMLEVQKSVQEAAQTVSMRHAGERSALTVMADAISQALTLAAHWHLLWKGLEERAVKKVKVKLNPDVMDTLSPEDIKALVATWQAGLISSKTVYYNLQWGEWARPGVEHDEELEDIEDEADDEDPALLPGVVVPPGAVPPQPKVE